MQYKKIMAIDYGDRRIGVAFSDFLQLTANPHSIFQNQSQQQTMQHICNLAKENSVEKIVLGMPYSAEGIENERTEITREFGEKLQDFCKIEVVFEDESLSSYEAEEILREKKVAVKDRKKHLDMLSAAIFLQTYLNRKQ